MRHHSSEVEAFRQGYLGSRTAADAVAAFNSSEVEAFRQSYLGSRTAADAVAAFAMLPGTAVTHWDHTKAPCTRYSGRY